MAALSMDELAVFLTVVESQGFSAAAKRLETTPAAVSRRIKAPLCCNNGEVLAEAAMQGLGITLLPDFIVEDALSDGRLVRVLDGRERAPLSLSVLYPSRRHVPVKTRSFIDYVVEQLT
jgi:DNA-binding transcriptional LysR family regulator